MNKRPTSSYVIAIASLILASLAMVQAIWFDQQNGLRTGAIVLFLVGLIWAYYVFPKVDVKSDSVVVSNPLTISEVGFGAIEDVDTRFALKLVGEGKSVSAWAAPAPGRHRHRHTSTDDFRFLGLREGDFVLFTDDVHAELDALVADEHRRPGNELSDLVLALAAEAAVQDFFAGGALLVGHVWGCALLRRWG